MSSVKFESFGVKTATEDEEEEQEALVKLRTFQRGRPTLLGVRTHTHTQTYRYTQTHTDTHTDPHIQTHTHVVAARGCGDIVYCCCLLAGGSDRDRGHRDGEGGGHVLHRRALPDLLYLVLGLPLCESKQTSSWTQTKISLNKHFEEQSELFHIQLCHFLLRCPLSRSYLDFGPTAQMKRWINQIN